MPIKNNALGVNMLDIVISLAILFIIMALSVPYLLTLRVENLPKETADAIVAQLRVAQARTMFGDIGDAYGVHLESGKFVLFKSGAYNPADPENFSTDLGGELEIYNISVGGGGSDIIFSRPRGTTGNYGSFRVRLKGNTAYWEISVSSEGVTNSNYVK